LSGKIVGQAVSLPLLLAGHRNASPYIESIMQASWVAIGDTKTTPRH
jgi:hypothetical protein